MCFPTIIIVRTCRKFAFLSSVTLSNQSYSIWELIERMSFVQRLRFPYLRLHCYETGTLCWVGYMTFAVHGLAYHLNDKASCRLTNVRTSLC